MKPSAHVMNWMSFSTNRQRLQEGASFNSLCLLVCPPAYPYLITREPMKGFSRSAIQKFTNNFLLRSTGWKVVTFQEAYNFEINQVWIPKLTQRKLITGSTQKDNTSFRSKIKVFSPWTHIVIGIKEIGYKTFIVSNITDSEKNKWKSRIL